MEPDVHVPNEHKNTEHTMPQSDWDAVVADAERLAKEAEADGR